MSSSDGRLRVKRAIDIVASAILLVVLGPVLIVLAALVRWRLGRPVLFRQARAGRSGVPFVILKFRTMTSERGPDGELLPDADRLTHFGTRLRATSLDELPELVNVLRGEMSLVGPRPLPLTYLPRYQGSESRRHEVRPGITGWAQVNGRNSSSWEERLAMDVWYVDNQSLALDLRILARTLRSVLFREGIQAEGHVTMHELRPPNDR